MKIQEQVCTKSQAMRLKELGVAQKSVFYYHPHHSRPVIGTETSELNGCQVMVCNDKDNAASAYSVAELGVMLPKRVHRSYIQYHLEFATKHNGHSVRYVTANREDILLECRADNEADARAQMLILLFDSNEITAQAVNQRLTQ